MRSGVLGLIWRWSAVSLLSFLASLLLLLLLRYFFSFTSFTHSPSLYAILYALLTTLTHHPVNDPFEAYDWLHAEEWSLDRRRWSRSHSSSRLPIGGMKQLGMGLGHGGRRALGVLDRAMSRCGWKAY